MARKPTSKAVTNPLETMPGLYRRFVPYNIPSTMDAGFWRTIVKKQPFLGICQTNIIMHIQSLDWDIRARDSERSDELRDDITYYRNILNRANKGAGWLNYVALLLQDFYTIPFGAVTETIRYSDGSLYEIQRVDGGTFYPPMDFDKHVAIQYVPAVSTNEIYFRKDEAVRMYMMPRTDIFEAGWGMAPPEKIYLAVELLTRGDKYYANLLLDTPEAGLLDLGDMSKESAQSWLKDFREMFAGIDPFKIPVLYEHTTPAKYLPFNRPPSELMYDTVTLKYAQIATAGHGITISDLGVAAGGQSLAGQIRSERASRATGYSSAKKYLTEHINNILPPELEFWFVDINDELLVAKGRARSANAVAGRNLIESGAITPAEWRSQLRADGLITVPLPERPDNSEFDILKDISGLSDQLDLKKQELDMAQSAGDGTTPKAGGQGGFSLNKQRNVRGGKLESVQGKDTVPASQGGMGEIKADYENTLEESVNLAVDSVYNNIRPEHIRKIVKNAVRGAQPIIAFASGREDYAPFMENLIAHIFGKDNDLELPPDTAIGEVIRTNIVEKSLNEAWYKLSNTVFETAYTSLVKDLTDYKNQLIYEDNGPTDAAVTIRGDLDGLLGELNTEFIYTLSRTAFAEAFKYYQERTIDLTNDDDINQIAGDTLNTFYDVYPLVAQKIIAAHKERLLKEDGTQINETS